jgi:hypothetical protein
MLDIFRMEPGWRGSFTREQATGALANGTRVVKARSEAKDKTPTGTPGIVLGSYRHPDIMNNVILYFVAWASAPRIAVACVEWKLRAAEEWPELTDSEQSYTGVAVVQM